MFQAVEGRFRANSGLHAFAYFRQRPPRMTSRAARRRVVVAAGMRDRRRRRFSNSRLSHFAIPPPEQI